MQVDRTQVNGAVSPGAIHQIAPILNHLAPSAIFLVCDESAYELSGAAEKLQPVLARRAVTRFDQFHPNPALADVEAGVALFQQRQHDVVLAVGGGSALDVGKLIAGIGNQRDSTEAVVRGVRSLDGPSVPLIAVPTTAGTGSEATQFAVCYVGQEKFSVADPKLLPTYAVVDPDLTASQPRAVAAAAGLDCLSQAIESQWSVCSTGISQAFAAHAAASAIGHLQSAVNEPSPVARLAMSSASHLAGRAINISKTTAPHAISYTLTMQFGVPHGFAVAVTLPTILNYNAQIDDTSCLDARGAAHVRRTIDQLVTQLDCGSVDEASNKLRQLIKSVGGYTRLSQCGVSDRADIELLVQGVNAQRLANNPRALPGDALRQLLLDLM